MHWKIKLINIIMEGRLSMFSGYFYGYFHLMNIWLHSRQKGKQNRVFSSIVVNGDDSSFGFDLFQFY